MENLTFNFLAWDGIGQKKIEKTHSHMESEQNSIMYINKVHIRFTLQKYTFHFKIEVFYLRFYI